MSIAWRGTGVPSSGVVMLDAEALARRAAFEDYRGVRILVADASGLRDADDIIALIRHTEALIRREPPQSVRIVMIVRGMLFDRRAAAAIKRVFQDIQPWIRASCLIGVTGLLSVLLQVLNRVVKRERPLFDALEPAREWLAGHP